MKTVSAQPVSSVLASPLAQLGQARLLNQICNWGFSDHKFENLYSRALDWHRALPINLQPTQGIVLDIGLSSFADTFTELLQLMHFALKPSGDVEGMDVFRWKFKEDDYFHYNGISWRVVDFAPHDGGNPHETIPSPDLAVLWALISSPDLLLHLRDHGVFSLWMYGVHVNHRAIVPYIKMDQGFQRTELNLGRVIRSEGRSYPRFVNNVW